MYSRIFSFVLFCSYCQYSVARIANQIPGKDGNDTLAKHTYFIINKISIEGNKITKPGIIYRELLFHENDSIDTNKLKGILEQSRKNLLNTSLFNFATIDTLNVHEGKTDIKISVVERWYIWPVPFLQINDRNFNVWWKTKDFYRADYGINLDWENFRGRKESVIVMIRAGFDQTFALSYKIPYINKDKTIGMGISAGYTGNHEVAYVTQKDVQLSYKDEDKYVQQNIFATFNITYRPDIYNFQIFQVNYNHYLFSDTLFKLNPHFATNEHVQYFTFYYFFRSDHRDIAAYPLKGYYFDLELNKNGFGILKDENLYASYLHTSIRKFWQIHNRWYLASGINAKLSNNASQPYFIERGLGYGPNFVRSYEYYVVDGQDYALLKTNLKYELIKTGMKRLKFIPYKKFSLFYYAVYLGCFVDAGYVDNVNKLETVNNNLPNTGLLGGGLNLDIVTYYDVVWSVQYSINKMCQYGLFLHFSAPI
ncbi:MAG: POTRA domain-containing protein [Bacteroidales bacterium]|jgi:outer membrane protein assembly factor BamA